MQELRTSVASHIRSAQTPAEALRQTLGQLEAEIGKLAFGDPDRPARILSLFDEAQGLLETLEEQGAALAGERSRLGTVSETLKKKGALFLKQMGGVTALAQARQERQPPEEAWWWFIDTYLAEQQRNRLRRTLRSLGIAAGVLAVVIVLYILFLQPDKATRLQFGYELRADQAMSEGDIAGAMVQIDNALAIAPGDPDLLVTKGVLQDLLGQEADAEATFATAEGLFPDQVTFLSTRAQAYMRANQPEAALKDAQAIIALDPNSAIGYFQMGSANTALGNYYDAMDNYDQASTLARAAGETELEGMARVQSANVMQILMSPQWPSGTPTP